MLPGAARALDRLDLSAPGASAPLMETLRASSLLIAARDAGRVAPVDLMAAARAEYGRLLELLYEEGHYAPTIRVLIDGREAADIPALATPSRIGGIDVQITLGPRFDFGRIEITPLAPGSTLPDAFQTGQPARSTVVRQAAASALDDWRAQGHAQARVQGQQATADHGAARLNLRLVLDPGPQLRVGRTIPEGNTRTRAERITAIAGLEPGALHNPDAIAEAETRLRRTGAFDSVVLRNAERANPDGTLDIIASVDESLPRRLGFGAEIDSQSGGRISGFWLHRNLFGGAERLRLEASVDGIGAQVGGLGFALDARFVRPATLDPQTDLELGLNLVRLNEADFLADALTAEALLRRRVSGSLTASAGLSLRFENADIGNFGTFGLPVTLTHDTRDDALDPTRGHFLTVEAMPYLGFGAADHGIRLRLDARAYRDPGTGGRLVLAARAQAGALVGASLAGAPRGFLLYSGGGGSVRGLPYQSLGVAGPPPSGGLGFAALSTEARVRINDSFSLVAFADAGAVSSGVFTGSRDWHAGGGFGLRYATPIGPMRLDVATPLRRHAGATGSAVQLYLGIGQAF